MNCNAITDSSAPGTLVDWLARRADTAPDAVYLSYEGRDYTFAEMSAGASSIAAHLHERGIRPGDRVAAMLHNDPVSIAALLAIAQCRAVWVPVNVQARAEGLRYQLEHSQPSLMLVEAELLEFVRASGADIDEARLVVKALPGGGSESSSPSVAAMFSAGLSFEGQRPATDDLFAISYTSGTTGRPKGVLVTYRMLEFSARGALMTSQARDGDVFFVWEPLYHIGGAQLIAVPLLAQVRLAMVPRFSASRFWRQVAESGATHIHYLGGIPQMLLKSPASEQDTAHRARIAWGAGLPEADWAPFAERFGLRINECYGMTEASSFTSCNLDGTPGSVGSPVPWLAYRICDTDGKTVPVGVPGEIVVRERAPGALFKGYYRNPEATDKALRNGELWTGDLGKVDEEGHLYFLGRSVDSLRIRGENVSAWEIEHVAKGHADVDDAAAVGVAADVGEQEALLYVKRVAGSTLSRDELARWLRPRLGKHQMPRYVAFIDGFEYTPSQRLKKHLLARDIGDCLDTRVETQGAPTATERG